jgi:hypothetical protein
MFKMVRVIFLTMTEAQYSSYLGHHQGGMDAEIIMPKL